MRDNKDNKKQQRQRLEWRATKKLANKNAFAVASNSPKIQQI